MVLLAVGVAVGVLVTWLLREWARFEAVSTASLRDELEELRETVEALTGRIESLEAIASEEAATAIPGIEDAPLGNSSQASPRKRVPLT